MGNYLSPGVYTREIDFSFYVKQLSTSACGMIGIAERGPVNKPVLVTSWEQFVNKFGSYLQARLSGLRGQELSSTTEVRSSM